MFGSELLDVAIGIVFLYVLMATLCTAVVEVFSTMRGLRAKQLEKVLVRILTDEKLDDALKQVSQKGGLKARFDAHPLIQALNNNGVMIQGKISKPSYIPSRTVVAALLDIAIEAAKELSQSHDGVPATVPTGITPGLTPANPALAELRNILLKLPEGSTLRTMLFSMLETSQIDISQFTSNSEKWFDDVMDRLSGAYKRFAQYIVLGIAAVLVFLLNVDTISIVDQLSKDDAMRESIVAAATNYVANNQDPATGQLKQDANTLPMPETVKKEDKASPAQGQLQQDANAAPTTGTPKKEDKAASTPGSEDKVISEKKRQIEELLSAIPAAGFKIGWQPDEWCKLSCADRLKKIFGLLLTTFAVSLGAPFWFDLLNKLVNLRGSGAKPTVTPEKAAPPKP